MFKELFKNIYIVSTENPDKQPLSYCYYIDDEIKTLIDTPVDPDFADYFKNKAVEMIINTHGHRDHAGCNHLFPGAKIYVHPLDKAVIQSKKPFVTIMESTILKIHSCINFY